ncbi:hydroxymethylglutaryl-CoA lyase [Pontibacter sp. BAB1700]|nr:hydroxymethylglutaryl-CoA lyase [Pontibacter sp. BAB1700]
MTDDTIKIIECPRDAMQGLHDFIPTQTKIDYINQLLQVGFDTIDFGSFVSPKAIPQMADTAEVLAGLNLRDTRSKLLAIIANVRGAEEAASHAAIDYLAFRFPSLRPFSSATLTRASPKPWANCPRSRTSASARTKRLLRIFPWASAILTTIPGMRLPLFALWRNWISWA